jgi:3-deoxy-D-manno-octulosonic-acid transferase
LSLLLYQLFLIIYGLAIRIASLFNPKAALWVHGRKGWRDRLTADLQPGEHRIWMHCASLGEFEQGRPVLEALRLKHPNHKLVLTFFSPSGYEVRKNYDGADYIFYLPLDGKAAARTFIHLVDPKLILFVKYEFWYYYLNEAMRRRIPTLLIAAAFRPKQPFFKWYGGFFRKILGCFSNILVQDEASALQLSKIGINGCVPGPRAAAHTTISDIGEQLPFTGALYSSPKVTVAGDTRYDRVAGIAAAARVLPEVEAFKVNSQLLIGGSTWPADERIMKALLPHLPDEWKMVLAPHEIDGAHLAEIRKLFGSTAQFFSEWKVKPDSTKKVLIIDNIGMLSSLYRYGAVAFIGGGFNKGGIHNVLEPAVFGLPVLMGPVYQKFVEAVALVDANLAFPVSNRVEATAKFVALTNDTRRDTIKQGLLKFMQHHLGATDTVMAIIERSRWLG